MGRLCHDRARPRKYVACLEDETIAINVSVTDSPTEGTFTRNSPPTGTHSIDNDIRYAVVRKDVLHRDVMCDLTTSI